MRCRWGSIFELCITFYGMFLSRLQECDLLRHMFRGRSKGRKREGLGCIREEKVLENRGKGIKWACRVLPACWSAHLFDWALFSLDPVSTSLLCGCTLYSEYVWTWVNFKLEQPANRLRSLSKWSGHVNLQACRSNYQHLSRPGGTEASWWIGWLCKASYCEMWVCVHVRMHTNIYIPLQFESPDQLNRKKTLGSPCCSCLCECCVKCKGW